jgi:predicted RNase H-like HicB family nuclease
MNRQILQHAKDLASRNYTIQISEDRLSDNTLIFMAKNPELFGCMAQGFSREEAISNLSEARVDYIYDSIIEGTPIPDPFEFPLVDVTIQITKFNWDDKKVENIISSLNRKPSMENNKYKVFFQEKVTA